MWPRMATRQGRTEECRTSGCLNSCEHLFVTARGSYYSQFRRALERGMVALGEGNRDAWGDRLPQPEWVVTDRGCRRATELEQARHFWPKPVAERVIRGVGDSAAKALQACLAAIGVLLVAWISGALDDPSVVGIVLLTGLAVLVLSAAAIAARCADTKSNGLLTPSSLMRGTTCGSVRSKLMRPVQRCVTWPNARKRKPRLLGSELETFSR